MGCHCHKSFWLVAYKNTHTNFTVDIIGFLKKKQTKKQVFISIFQLSRNWKSIPTQILNESIFMFKVCKSTMLTKYHKLLANKNKSRENSQSPTVENMMGFSNKSLFSVVSTPSAKTGIQYAISRFDLNLDFLKYVFKKDKKGLVIWFPENDSKLKYMCCFYFFCLCVCFLLGWLLFLWLCRECAIWHVLQTHTHTHTKKGLVAQQKKTK